MNDWRKLARRAKKAVDSEIHGLYQETFGAEFSGNVTPARARESIIEACMEMLNMAKGKSSTEEITLDTINTKLDKILSWMNHVKPTGFDGVVAVEGKAVKVDVPPPPKKEEPKEKEVTIEQLREIATRYSTAFGMKDLLALVSQHGAKKLSEVDPKDYALLASDMNARIEREGAKPAEAATPEKSEEKKPEITLDAIKPQAKAFFDKNGEKALAALLKSFGAKKLSEVAADKYPALMEALLNA